MTDNLFKIDILDFTGDVDYPQEQPFVIRSYNLADYLGASLGDEGEFHDNHSAERLVQNRLAIAAPSLVERLSFDSESGCFFAYATNYADALRLVGVIYELVAGLYLQEVR